MKKILLISCLLSIFLIHPKSIFAFDWNKFEKRAYTISEFVFIGSVAADASSTLACEKIGIFEENNPIASHILKTGGEKLFVFSVTIYGIGTIFTFRKLRHSKNEKLQKGSKIASWMILSFLTTNHLMATSNNLSALN